MEAMEAAAKEAEVPDGAERRLPSPPSTPSSEASEEIPMHAAWWAEERPDLFLPVPLLSRAITIPRDPCSLRGTVVAVDGKFSSTRQKWGVGVFDIKAGIGHVAGGCYAGCSSASIGENGMEQSTVEAIAVHMGFDWVRKRQRLPLSLFRSNGFRKLEKDITLISGRTATMVTMMRFGRVAARQFDSQLPGFEVAIHNAAVPMVKMLLLFTKVVIIHKSVEPFQAAQDQQWSDTLLTETAGCVCCGGGQGLTAQHDIEVEIAPVDGCSERARNLTEGDSRDDRVSPEPLLLEPAQPLVCTLPPDEAGITPQYLAHHSIMQPRARPNRARCQCLCGCRRRPGCRAACEVCQQLVGPGCCVETTTPLRCHVCAYHFPARDLQRQQMQTQSHHSQQQLRQAPQQPKQGAWAQRDRDEREVAEGTPETSTMGKRNAAPL